MYTGFPKRTQEFLKGSSLSEVELLSSVLFWVFLFMMFPGILLVNYSLMLSYYSVFALLGVSAFLKVYFMN